MVAQDVILSVRRYLTEVEQRGISVSFAVIFGSQVMGETDEWSDIDLVVVSPRFDNMKDRRDVDTLWLAAADVDSRIEPVACGLKRWQLDGGSPILEVARRYGEVVSSSRESA